MMVAVTSASNGTRRQICPTGSLPSTRESTKPSSAPSLSPASAEGLRTGTRESGPSPEKVRGTATSLTWLKQPFQDGLLHVQAVRRLLEDGRRGTFEHRFGDLLAAMRRQA